MMLIGSCQQHQNRPNPDSKKPQPTRVRGHTLSKGGVSVLKIAMNVKIVRTNSGCSPDDQTYHVRPDYFDIHGYFDDIISCLW